MRHVNILWAEDKKNAFSTFRKTLTVYLERHGIVAEIVQAVDGDAVFRLLPKRPWDLLVIDIVMHDYGGIELIEDLLASWPALPKIVVSDYVTDEHVAPRLEAFGRDRAITGYFAVEPRAAWCEAMLRALSSAAPCILHMSDLHFGDSHSLPPELKLEQVLETALCDVKMRFGVNLLVISGDFCSRGAEEEFARAREFIGNAAARLDISLDRVIVVPGNHDVFRPAPTERRFGHFMEFVQDVYRASPEPANVYSRFAGLFDKGRGLWKREARACNAEEIYSIAIMDGLRMVVVGLNSIISEDGRLDLGEILPAQLLHISRELNALKPPQSEYVRTCVFHHHLLVVPSFLSSGLPERLVRNQSLVLHHMIANRFRLLLHGHTHYGGGFYYRPYFVDAEPGACDGIHVFSAGTLSGRARESAQSYFNMNVIRFQEGPEGRLDRARMVPFRLYETAMEWRSGPAIDFSLV